MDKTIIAMWSGPRNLSTAMMRSFENRSDTVVLDEPFYAHFLDKTNLNHPGRDEVLLSQDCNWNNVVKMITGPIPQNKPIWYQKHMAQHNLDGCDISWIKNLNNCILIRHPKYVIPSYNREYSISNEQLLGYPQQLDLIRVLEEELGVPPPIFDATDILKNPEKGIKKICMSLGIPFSKKMLKWPKGKEIPMVFGQSTGIKMSKTQHSLIHFLKRILIYQKSLFHYMINVGFIIIACIKSV